MLFNDRKDSSRYNKGSKNGESSQEDNETCMFMHQEEETRFVYPMCERLLMTSLVNGKIFSTQCLSVYYMQKKSREAKSYMCQSKK